MIQMALTPSRLILPMDAATQKFAFLGRTGTGKSYAASKLAEQLLINRAQIVAIDPVGIWYGLRIGADGKSPGLTINLFGGLHGDVPLESTAGALIADLIIDRGISSVVDVSQFESDAQKCRFASDFASRLFYRKKAEPGPIMLFLEEAQEFIPQNPEKNETTMLHAFSRLCKIGRNFGIGAAIVSQRPQEINKKVLNMTECMFSFQMTGPQERDTIKRWVQDKGADLDIVNDLPRFEVGQCHVWSQQWLKISKTVKIAPKQTFNASSTPQFGSARKTEPNPLQPAELENLRKAMAETIERAERDDPSTLRKRIAQLETQLKAANATPAADLRAIEQRHAEVVRRYQTAAKRAVEMLAGIPQAVEATREFIAPIAGEGVPSVLADAVKVTDRASVALQKNLAEHRATSNGHEPESGKGERRLLIAIAQYPNGVTTETLAVLTGYKATSRRVYLQRLLSSGLIEKDYGKFLITEVGKTSLGTAYQPLPVGDALRDYWMTRLPDGERKLLGVAVGAYPRAVTAQALQEATNYKPTSVRVYSQRLVSRQLLIRERGELRAARELFG
jgi:hypothetical protein